MFERFKCLLRGEHLPFCVNPSVHSADGIHFIIWQKDYSEDLHWIDFKADVMVVDWKHSYNY